jgi:hypothetical protein
MRLVPYIRKSNTTMLALTYSMALGISIPCHMKDKVHLLSAVPLYLQKAVP